MSFKREDVACCSVAILVAAALLVLALLPTVLSVADAQRRSILHDNLKQLAVAMHTYRDEHRTLPPHAVFDKAGRPLLSWRVLVLPYLGQEELYKQFRLDEPWDSPHNQKFLERMPPVFLHPVPGADEEPFTTHFQVFVGQGAAFEGERGLRLPQDFPDGLWNTILIAEAAQAVPWTKPEDLPYAFDRPLPKLGGLIRGGGFYVACADGSVQQFLPETSEATLRALITRHGNDKPGPDWNP